MTLLSIGILLCRFRDTETVNCKYVNARRNFNRVTLNGERALHSSACYIFFSSKTFSLTSIDRHSIKTFPHNEDLLDQFSWNVPARNKRTTLRILQFSYRATCAVIPPREATIVGKCVNRWLFLSPWGWENQENNALVFWMSWSIELFMYRPTRQLVYACSVDAQ